MRFKNKKTGVVQKIYPSLDDSDSIKFMAEDGHHYEYKTLEGFFAEWEDAPEEPKKVWFIDADGDIDCCTQECEYDECGLEAKGMKSIGNYFETEEEAEQAVEKLRAYKRLKDKGFRFKGRYKPNYGEDFIVGCRLPKETLVVDVAEDLDLLFGGEE